MEKKVLIVMFHNSTNINKANNHLSNEIIEHKKDHDVKHPGPGFEQAQKMYRG